MRLSAGIDSEYGEREVWSLSGCRNALWSVLAELVGGGSVHVLDDEKLFRPSGILEF